MAITENGPGLKRSSNAVTQASPTATTMSRPAMYIGYLSGSAPLVGPGLAGCDPVRDVTHLLCEAIQALQASLLHLLTQAHAPSPRAKTEEATTISVLNASLALVTMAGPYEASWGRL